MDPRHRFHRFSKSLFLLLPLACGSDPGTDDTDAGTTGDMSTSGTPTTGTPTTGDMGTTDTGTTSDTGTTGDTGDAAQTVALELVAEDFVAPVNMAVAPDGTMVVLDQPGIAYRIEGDTKTPFLDLEARVIALSDDYDERGLLGMAFHPNYPEDPRVFAYYSERLREGAPAEYDHTNVLAEFQVVDGVVDTNTTRELLVLDWPYSNHNGGTVHFGADDMLYVSLGDGGNANDVGVGHPEAGNGQDWTTLMGSILRIDPDGGTEGGNAYGIPEDNPFTGEHDGADEIWAYGVRNPSQFAFDPESGALYLGDAGQNLMEEVSIAGAGDNLGWNIMEGTLCFNPDDPDQPLDDCMEEGAQGEPLVAPIMTYTHPDTAVSDLSEIHGVVVVGGRVYRGSALEDLSGTYIFGDWSRSFSAPEGQLFIGRPEGDAWTMELLEVEGTPEGHIGHYVRAFGQDNDGEIYILTSQSAGPTGMTGDVWRLVPAS